MEPIVISETPQEAFDKVWKWFVVDKNPRSSNGTNCLYRGPKGEKCAFGVLIPDDKYDPSLDPRGLDHLVASGLIQFNHEKTRRLCARMQLTHDHTSSLGNFHEWMRTELTRIAIIYDLVVPQ